MSFGRLDNVGVLVARRLCSAIHRWASSSVAKLVTIVGLLPGMLALIASKDGARTVEWRIDRSFLAPDHAKTVRIAEYQALADKIGRLS